MLAPFRSMPTTLAPVWVRSFSSTIIFPAASAPGLHFDSFQPGLAQEGRQARGFLKQRGIGGLCKGVSQCRLRTGIELHCSPVEQDAGNHHDQQREQQDISRRKESRAKKGHKKNKNAGTEHEDRPGNDGLKAGFFGTAIARPYTGFCNNHRPGLQLAPYGN